LVTISFYFDLKVCLTEFLTLARLVLVTVYGAGLLWALLIERKLDLFADFFPERLLVLP
jgi:hypothetical protein